MNEANFRIVYFCLDPADCLSNPCHNNGTCVLAHNGGHSCECEEGFTGSLCETGKLIVLLFQWK